MECQLQRLSTCEDLFDYVKIFVICSGTVHILWSLWMMSGMLRNYYFSRLLNVIFHQNNLNPSVTHHG